MNVIISMTSGQQYTVSMTPSNLSDLVESWEAGCRRLSSSTVFNVPGDTILDEAQQVHPQLLLQAAAISSVGVLG